ncbi:SDR family NAD(P)-dependent oxidoreductase [Agromyces silvae]|uniref:SDR family NAD(P)-dependent oxidoreductase n=1 Tax=Agromyces silvae TaxID=3388266 RepID=UPI00280B791F|nr:SDR family oxidoreductase [Agromyces protaetiae]
MLLEGKTAIVFGGAGAIGSATAAVFSREGAHVALAGRTAADLDRVADALADAGGSVQAEVVDALDESAVERYVDTVARDRGRVDIVLNAVGVDHVQGLPIVDTGVEDFLYPVTTYLRTNFLTARAAARVMVPQGAGVVLTISTPGARLSGPGLVGNAAQSAGLEGFSRALAGELAPHGVRVVCVRPHALSDAVSTSYTGAMFARIAQGAGLTLDEWLAGAASGAPIGRLPETIEVAEYLAFAASDRVGVLTGVVANLTGGAIVD